MGEALDLSYFLLPLPSCWTLLRGSHLSFRCSQWTGAPRDRQRAVLFQFPDLSDEGELSDHGHRDPCGFFGLDLETDYVRVADSPPPPDPSSGPPLPCRETFLEPAVALPASALSRASFRPQTLGDLLRRGRYLRGGQHMLSIFSGQTHGVMDLPSLSKAMESP